MNRSLISGLCGSLALLAVTAAQAVEHAGTVKTLQGTVQLLRNGQQLPVSIGTALQASDRIRTGEKSSVGITLRDNTLLSAGSNSTLALNQFAFNPTTHQGQIDATLKRGTLSVISGKIAKTNPDKVIFRSANVTLGVRGTEFILEGLAGGEE